MSVSLQGYNTSFVTFTASNGIKAGDLAEFNGYRNVVPCKQGNVPIGKCVAVNGGYATVQLSGYMDVKFDVDPSIAGYVNVVADGKGNLKVDPKGKTVLVVGNNAEYHQILF